MAHSIQITDGVTTADLYALSATFIASRGWEMAGGGSEDEVGETLDLYMRGANVAALQTQVQTIERLIDAAERRTKTGVGNKVYLVVQFDTEAAAWRTEIRSGRLDMTDAPDRLHTLVLEARLGLTRLNYWEWAAADVELQLSGVAQAAATGGRTLTNGAGSWVQIAAAQVTGNVPAPLRLELVNSNGTRTFSEIHVALNTDNAPASFPYIIEGEDASSGGSTASSASASGGSYRSVSVNTSATVTWTLDAATTQAAKGAPFLLIARIHSQTGFVAMRPSLRIGSTILWEGHQARGTDRLTPNLTILGMLPLPPMLWEADTLGAVTLAVEFSSAAAQTIGIDFLALFPCAPGNYRLLSMLGAGVVNGAAVIDDGIDGWASVRTSSQHQPLTSARGSAIYLHPNTLQRIYVLQHTDADCNVADVLTARAFYRPRRLTI